MAAKLTKSKIRAFHSELRKWYASHGRKDLPWRNTDDPYPIYISEVMLQQTQVKTVLERYYFPFLERFPSLTALAEAPEGDVLKRWEGLGYYNRAINLHKAAKQAQPKLPDSEEDLIALPGIGKNTARAVLAFGFHKPAAILEANVKRVVHRIFALEKADDKTMWECAERLLDAEHPFDYNQAMMDIGAMVCTKTKPDCTACPASGMCQGKAEPERYPAPKPKKAVPTHKRFLVIWEDEKGLIFLPKRESRHLNGLHGLPQYDSREEIALEGYQPASLTTLGNIVHVYSHYRLEAEVLRAPYPHRSNQPDWIAKRAITKIALSKADHKALALIQS